MTPAPDWHFANDATRCFNGGGILGGGGETLRDAGDECLVEGDRHRPARLHEFDEVHRDGELSHVQRSVLLGRIQGSESYECIPPLRCTTCPAGLPPLGRSSSAADRTNNHARLESSLAPHC